MLPCTGTAPSQVDSVAVKLAKSSLDSDMLWTEGKIYNTFPRALQEGCLHAPPVVPKFYGLYVPSEELDYPELSAEELDAVREMIKGITPILLLEPCGQQVEDPSLTDRYAAIISSLI